MYTRFQRGGAGVARQAHNLEVAGAIPAPATRTAKNPPSADFLLCSEAVGERESGGLTRWELQDCAVTRSAE